MRTKKYSESNSFKGAGEKFLFTQGFGMSAVDFALGRSWDELRLEL